MDRKQFQPTDQVPAQSTSPLDGNRTHDLRLTISDLDHLASGSKKELLKNWLLPVIAKPFTVIGENIFKLQLFLLNSILHLAIHGYYNKFLPWNDNPDGLKMK